ncbi:SRPBCC family protein [Rubellimicrobium aerolatum]|uniref:SRPBCC family protein n=1 Tax=Rubellimicrobium aerolatum TaxID=490979 RepID=A0ABW0S928_9RHOB|nr:SRPBCC family protein [Rubellimicrobium aerolatum]MBP1804802.1 putative membrane protein [Rubellimicrobium aerolatum]
MDRDDSWLDEPRPSWPPHGALEGHHFGAPAPRPGPLTERRVVAAAATLGLGALVGLAAYAYLGPSASQSKRRADAPRLTDDAPGRTARQARFGDYAVTGRSVTIDRPREEIYAFWRDFANLPRFMENIVEAGEPEPGLSTWTIRAPLGQTVKVRSRIVNDRAGEQIAWRSTPDSQIETEGKVMFRDAPGGRGTIVETVIAYKPPMGALGQAVAKLFSAEPSVQARRDLKRLKMLLEAGEIATNVNRRDKANKAQQGGPSVQADLSRSATPTAIPTATA